MLSGRTRLAVCAGAAAITTACSLLPLVSPSGWLLEATLLVLVQAGVGALVRRVPLPRPVTVLAQALVSLELLTLLFARSQAAGGLLPGPEVFARFGELVTGGVRDVGHYAIPAPVTPGIRLLLLGGVVLVGLAVDALAVTYRSAAPAGLPLLALYSIAAGLSGNGSSSRLWFLTAACGYLLLLLAEGRDRLSRWGQVVGGPAAGGAPGGFGGRGPVQPGGTAVSPVRTGRRIGAMALGIALIAPAALPSLNGGMLAVPGAGTGARRGGGTITTVNPVVTLRNQLNQPDNRQVLSYTTNADNASELYLRFVALDQFNGAEWTPSKRALSDVPEQLPAPQGLGAEVRVKTFVAAIRADRNYAQTWLPLPYPAERVRIGGRWRYEPAGRTLIGDRGQNTQGVKYRVTALEVLPTAKQLASAPEPDAAFRAEYTKVPSSLPSVVKRTALRVTAGRRTDYAKAVALQKWFTSGDFTYSTSVRSGTGVRAITRFLKDKKGFCVHFAFTMAAMARTLGIPARVAVGFAPGTPQVDGSYSVGLRDAHAWPELYFQGVGWTRFEPTPSRGSVPAYTLDDTPPPSGGSAGLPQRGGRSAVPAPSASPSMACDAAGTAGTGTKGCGVTANGDADGGSAGGGPIGLKIAGWALLALLALTVPVVPSLLRRRTRRRRLAHGEPLAAWRELMDTGWDYGVPPDESETPRRAVARLIRNGGLHAEAAASARRVATAVEQALYARRPDPAAGLADDVRRVHDALHTAAGSRGRLAARLLPRSSIRAGWFLADRWSALTMCCAAAVTHCKARLRRA